MDLQAAGGGSRVSSLSVGVAANQVETLLLRRWCAAACAAACVLIGSGCSARSDERGNGTRSTLVPALCDSARLASSGRLAEAKAIFDDQVHDALHRLASDSGAVDRSASARLLEAKQVVESRFAQLDPVVAEALRVLVAATAVALASVDVTAVRECEE